MPVAFLWHLHQPDYRDPDTGIPVMPWVRMHALRGYRDLCLDVLRDGVAVTINVVPSLLDQMLHYATGGSDRHLDLTTTPAAELEPADVDEILGTFVAGNPAMIGASPAYARLAARIRGGQRPDAAGLRDLQVWSTLAWCGSTALRDFPDLVALREKGSGFSEADKAALLAVQRRILAELPEVFARVARSGTASISSSPYFHPILPLLVDNRHARRCMPHLPDEARFAWPEDALLQLKRARARVEELLGQAPIGLWPSEGSVSPEVVELAGAAGFRWLATDDGVLKRSDVEGGHAPHAGKHGPWDLGHGVRGFFRDRELSDRVGFDYARRDPKEAAAEVLGEAARRAGEGVITIALDGENPWEAFPDAGHAFRQHLHAGLLGGPSRGITLDAASERPPVGKVRRLHTGSWINSDFGIWIGHPEDRRAWRALDDARRAIADAPPDRGRTALERLLPAEGSDWMWWYGEEFSTPFAGTFDRLFRAHVRAAWRALGKEPPAELDHPISAQARLPVVAPIALVRPRLETAAPWVRWAGAGHVVFGRGASMARGEVHAQGLSFGWSPRPDPALWLRVEPVDPLQIGRAHV